MVAVPGIVAAVWKQESARIVAGLLRMVGDVGLAEELAQDALVAALEQWPVGGVPDNPGAWLTTIAKRRAIDHLRRTRRLGRLPDDPLPDRQPGDRHPDDGQPHDGQSRDGQPHDGQPHDGQPHDGQPGADRQAARDDVLRLMFISCHPVLPTAARAALTLRVIAGLTPSEIARAFLVAEPVIAQRIAAAKRSLADVPYELPAGPELTARLTSVLEVIYLIFNEGYSATSGTDLMRLDLCLEALRLGRLMAELAPDEAEVHGLVALMEIQQSRAAARIGPAGEPVQLHEQNRGRWDRLLIRRGFAAMLRARAAGGAGPYVLQAAIAVCHAQASTAEQTDWGQIATLYGALERLVPTPVVRLNRAVAVGFAHGPQAGLDLIEDLRPSLTGYHLLPSVGGDLLLRLGRTAEARSELIRAAALTRNDAERAFLLGRAAALDLPPDTGPTLGSAIDEFLGRPTAAPSTTRAYRQTLLRVRRGLGDRAALAGLTAAEVSAVFNECWASASPRSWNRHLSAVRSFAAWAQRPELAAGLVACGLPPAVHRPQIDPQSTLHGREAPLRERTLWTLLHESAAPIAAVLALDVDDLDLAARCSRSGDRRVTWQSDSARLLPALIGDRTRGPLFLSERRPGPARRPAPADLCPETGRRRLSYERAEYLFKKWTGGSIGQLRAR
jgi:predicted RNA polymerase sigma factor